MEPMASDQTPQVEEQEETTQPLETPETEEGGAEGEGTEETMPQPAEEGEGEE